MLSWHYEATYCLPWYFIFIWIITTNIMSVYKTLEFGILERSMFSFHNYLRVTVCFEVYIWFLVNKIMYIIESRVLISARHSKMLHLASKWTIRLAKLRVLNLNFFFFCMYVSVQVALFFALLNDLCYLSCWVAPQ